MATYADVKARAIQLVEALYDSNPNEYAALRAALGDVGTSPPWNTVTISDLKFLVGSIWNPKAPGTDADAGPKVALKDKGVIPIIIQALVDTLSVSIPAPPVPTALDAFCAYLAGGPLTILNTGTGTQITFDTETVTSSSTYSLNAGDVTVNATGTYLIQYDVGVEVSAGTTRNDVRVKLYLDAVAVPGSTGIVYTAQAGFGGTATCKMLLNLTSGQTLAVWALKAAAADTVVANPEHSRISLLRLA